MSLTTATGAGIVRPEEVGQLVVQPVIAASVALTVSSVVTTDAHQYRLPVITADPTAGWFAEGVDITPSDATVDEVIVTPAKVAGLTIISRELAEDSTPDAAQVVGDGLARDLARKIDLAFFANTTANGPDGLLSLTPQTVDTGGRDRRHRFLRRGTQPRRERGRRHHRRSRKPGRRPGAGEGEEGHRLE